MPFNVTLPVSGRLGCVFSTSSRKLALRSVPPLHGRLLSSASSQCGRLSLLRGNGSNYLDGASQRGSTRNYFWSSSKPIVADTLSIPLPLSINSANGMTSRHIEQAEATSAPNTADIPSSSSTDALSSSADLSSVSEPLSSASELSSSSLTSSLSDTTSTVASTLSPGVSPPLEFGTLYDLGLISFTPAGLVRLTLEAINVTTGLPWFYTIIAGTLMYRVLIFPLAVEGLRNSARLLPYAPRLAAIGKEMKIAQGTRDLLAMQRVQLKQKKVYEDAGVRVGPMLLAQFAQLPVTLGLFFGIKGMCQLPLEQLKYSGLDILPDLTVADPYFILPAMTALVINLQITVGSKEMNLVERPGMGHLMNAMRVLSMFSIPLMGSLPSGVMVSLITGVSAMTFQSYMLQRPAIRRAFNIPVVPKEVRGKLPSFASSIKFAKDKWEEKVSEAQAEARRQSNVKGRK